jgi:hypothetical protein
MFDFLFCIVPNNKQDKGKEDEENIRDHTYSNLPGCVRETKPNYL